MAFISPVNVVMSKRAAALKRLGESTSAVLSTSSTLLIPAAKKKAAPAWRPNTPRQLPASALTAFFTACLSELLPNARVKTVLPNLIYENLLSWLCYLRQTQTHLFGSVDDGVFEGIEFTPIDEEPAILAESVAIILGAAFGIYFDAERVCRDEALLLSASSDSEQPMNLAKAYRGFVAQELMTGNFVSQTAAGLEANCACGEPAGFQRGNRQWNGVDVYKCATNTCKYRLDFVAVPAILGCLKDLGVGTLPAVVCQLHPADALTIQLYVGEDNQAPRVTARCSHRKGKDPADDFCQTKCDLFDENSGALSGYRMALLQLIRSYLP